jgi:hypothetical protein
VHSAQIVASISERYLGTDDFNGLPLRALMPNGIDAALSRTVAGLIRDRVVDAIFGNTDMNSSIKRLGVETPSIQLKKLESGQVDAVLYPTPEYLATSVIAANYSGRPYTLELARGAAQLDTRAFELSVLEFYRNDPRYTYHCDDVQGWISLSDRHHEDPDVAERDRVMLDTFGFAYNEKMDRAVATFVWYLSRLSPEHQAVWKAKQLPDGFHVHPDFYRTQILAEFPDHLPVLTAFLMELGLINEMARAMGRAPLFRNVPENPPRKFGFLVRPTLSEFNDFVLALDKLVSDNIDKAFFANEVDDEEEYERPDGRLAVRTIGTLRMLERWLKSRFTPEDWSPFDAMGEAFRRIRKLRQKPAHVTEQDAFDQKYFHEQRKLILEAYGGVRTLRQVLANHPSARDIKVHNLLYLGKIRTF